MTFEAIKTFKQTDFNFIIAASYDDDVVIIVCL